MKRSQIDDRVAEIEARLAEIEAHYAQWNQELEEQRQQLVEGDMDWWKALQVVHARRARSIQDGTSPVDFETLNRLLEKLCAIYLKADEERRIAIRAIFDDKQSLLKCLHGYIGRAARHLKATKDKKWLRLGLAAASICDRRVDWRDLMICLGDLYMTAKEAGFRPAYQFTAVAKMSNPSRRYGESSTRDLLANFRKSAYLKSIQRQQLPDLTGL